MLSLSLLWRRAPVAALIYAQDRGILGAALASSCFLLEVTLYFMMGVERLRRRLEKSAPRVSRRRWW